MDIKTITRTEGGDVRLDTTDKKLAKYVKWLNTSPAIIQKPLHFVFQKFGYKSIEADIARACAKEGNGSAVNRLARRAYGMPNA